MGDPSDDRRDEDDLVRVEVADRVAAATRRRRDHLHRGRPLVLPKEGRGPRPPHAKPIVGAVNGVAVTGGLELGLAGDCLIASDRARFADTHARVGIMPGWGLTVLLPEAIGVRRAGEMSITGNYIDGQVALVWDLVERVVDHDELLPFCRQIAADIVSNDQVGVGQMLDTYQRGTATSSHDAVIGARDGHPLPH
jgi:enoyl-CoA hydratase